MSSPDPAQAEAPPRPAGTLRVGSLFGTEVLVGPSWFLGAALISFVMAPWIEWQQPGLGGWRYVAGFGFAVVLYLSVLVHELAHAVAARHYGFPVDSMTLHFLGGHTQIAGQARRPVEEFVIAVVGPITSLLIGFGGLALARVVPDGLLGMAVDLLALANLVVGVLNLVPGLPLDGGRVLKAAVWQGTGNVHQATLAAGWAGRVVAVGVLAWPVVASTVFGIDPQLTDYLLAGVIAVFLWTGASAAIAQARVRVRLPRLRADRLARRALAVPDDIPVAEAVRRAKEADAGALITLTPKGQLSGLVSEAALLATPEERRPWMAVSALSRTLDEGLVLPLDIAGEDLILRMQRMPASEYLLIDDEGRPAGVLATVDVDRAFREGTPA